MKRYSIKYKICQIVFIMFVMLIAGCSSTGIESSAYVEDYIPGDDYNYQEYSWLQTFGAHYLTQYNDSLYFVFGEYLFCHDLISGNTVPVCLKTDCIHCLEEDENKVLYCDAFLGGIAGQAPFVNVWNGKLYVLRLDRQTGDNILVSSDLSGNNQKILARFSIHDSIRLCIMHRGVIYVVLTHSDYGGQVGGLYAISCLDHNPKLVNVYEESGSDQWIQNVLPYGKYVYFEECTQVEGGYVSRIMKYDIQTCETIAYVDGGERDYQISGIIDDKLWIRIGLNYYLVNDETGDVVLSENGDNLFVDTYPNFSTHLQRLGNDSYLVVMYDKVENEFDYSLKIVSDAGEILSEIDDAAWEVFGGTQRIVINDKEYIVRYLLRGDDKLIAAYGVDDIINGVVNPYIIYRSDSIPWGKGYYARW